MKIIHSRLADCLDPPASIEIKPVGIQMNNEIVAAIAQIILKGKNHILVNLGSNRAWNA